MGERDRREGGGRKRMCGTMGYGIAYYQFGRKREHSLKPNQVMFTFSVPGQEDGRGRVDRRARGEGAKILE